MTGLNKSMTQTELLIIDIASATLVHRVENNTETQNYIAKLSSCIFLVAIRVLYLFLSKLVTNSQQGKLAIIWSGVQKFCKN